LAAGNASKRAGQIIKVTAAVRVRAGSKGAQSAREAQLRGQKLAEEQIQAHAASGKTLISIFTF
jgi:hypothetical protein